MSMSMQRNRYQDFRQELIDFIQKDVVGPFSEDEIVDDAPATKYSAGILFPQSVEAGEKEVERDENLDLRTRDEEDVIAVEQSTSFYPSAMGISFSVGEDIKELEIALSAARYTSVGKEDVNLVKVPIAGLPEDYFQHSAFSAKFEYKEGQLALREPISKAERDLFIDTFKENEDLKSALYKIYRLFDNGWKRVAISQQKTIDLTQSKSDIQLENEHLKIVAITKKIKGGKLS